MSISTLLVQSDLLQHYYERIKRGDVPGNHAVVLGLTMAALTIPRETALAGELYAFTSNTIASAVRMTLIDHRIAQLILHRLKPVIVAVTAECQQKRVQDIGGCAPLIDIMAMRHEQAEMRLFMS